MKKIGLLTFFAFASVASVSADEYWIVKDGIISPDVEQVPYAPALESGYDTLVSGQEDPDGNIVALYEHHAAYNDVRFDLSKKPLDLNKSWVFRIEYSAPFALKEDSTVYKSYLAYKTDGIELHDGTKPAIRCGLDPVADSMNLESMYTLFDVQMAYNAMNGTGPNYVTEDRLVFSNQVVSEMNSFVLSYIREVTNDLSDEPLYIKNMGFISVENEVRPFYTENFTYRNQPNVSNITAKKYNSLKDPDVTHGGYLFKGTPMLPRVWDKPFDESGLFAAELVHALLVSGSEKSVEIDIPEGLTKLDVQMLIKFFSNDKDQGVIFPTATEDDRKFSITMTFDNSDEPVALFDNSLLDGKWTMESQEVAIPSGAKSFILKFNADKFDFAVDQIEIGGTFSTTIRTLVDGVQTVCIVGGANSDVEEFSSIESGTITVYPNPASDVASVNVNASKVEVISLTGAVVASAEGNSVSVSALAAGSYIIKAYTSNGVVATTFVKK